MLKAVFFIICLPSILYGLENNLSLQSNAKIPIENVHYCYWDSSNIFALKPTNHPEKKYGWNNLENFSEGTKKVRRSMFFYLCAVCNISLYEPEIGYAFLDEEIVCFIEQPTFKHIADLIKICAIDSPEPLSLKEEVINLLLKSYALQKLTRPWNNTSDVAGYSDMQSFMFHVVEKIIPTRKSKIDTCKYKLFSKTLYLIAKDGYKRSLYLYVGLAIGLFCMNRLGMLNITYVYGSALPLLYGIFSAIYFYNKLDDAYDDLQKALQHFDSFAEQYNDHIQKEIDIEQQHINCERRFNNKLTNQQVMLARVSRRQNIPGSLLDYDIKNDDIQDMREDQ